MTEPLPVPGGRQRVEAAFVRSFLVAALILIAGISTANYLVNPLGMYPVHLFPPMVRNARADKIALLRASQPRPAAFVLGSSRVMQMPPTLIAAAAGVPAFNFAVDSARAEDDYVILRYLLEEAHITPRLLLIGIDVEAFHNNVAPDERLLKTASLARFLAPAEARGAAMDRVGRLLSAQQTNLMVRSVTRSLVSAAASPAKPADTAFSHFEKDGYLRYDWWEQDRKAGRFDLNAHIPASVQEYLQRFDGYTALSPSRKDYLHSLLSLAKANHTVTVMFITPIGPQAEAALGHAYAARRAEVAAFLEAEASGSGTQYIEIGPVGRYDDEGRGYWDGAHLDDHSSARLTAFLLAHSRAVQ